MDPSDDVPALPVLGLVSQSPLSRGPASKEKCDKEELPDWQWSIYDQFTDKMGRVNLTKREAGNSDAGAKNGPFQVIYVNQKIQQWPDKVQVQLFSRPLRKTIEQYLPNNGDLKTLEEPIINGRELFIVLDALKNHKFGSSEGGEPPHLSGNGMPEISEGELHLKYLVRFMENEYRDVISRVRRMLEEKQVAWDLMWAFLPCGKKVVYNCDHSGELLYAVVDSNYFSFDIAAGEYFFVVLLDIWEFDGRSYKQCRISRKSKKYEGERSFASLPFCPVELLGMPEVWEERFLEHGKRYFDLTMKRKHRFVHYTGPLFQKKLRGNCWQLHKENADGRVMIDLKSFAKMNPLIPMDNAAPPTASRSFMTCGADGSFSMIRSIHLQQVACELPGESSVESHDQSDSAALEVSDKTLIFAPGIVYGFSFTLKLWGSFAVGGFRDISFDSSAFHELVMEPQTKGLVHNLVRHYIGTPPAGSKRLRRVDPISNKGNGCIFLCYGPPGTGKTLTAESIAETMGRPLWALSVSELGTQPNELEQTLFKVLDIAVTWRAVLLFDEADVYLEKRISGADLTRNAMTGVFLRMLEYYRGVLFLTTNRIGTFDNAFRSRISIFLHYPPLSAQHKGQIWKALLEKAGVVNVGSEKLSNLAALELNGREIRNAIHTAQSLAQSNDETLDLNHVQFVMSIVDTSLTTLNEQLRAPAYN